MRPVLRRTWAPCGVTPTRSVRTRSHEKVSGIGAPRRRQLTLTVALYARLNIRGPQVLRFLDRKSTRLNSSHEWISYAVFCLKKKKNTQKPNYVQKPKL